MGFQQSHRISLTSRCHWLMAIQAPIVEMRECENNEHLTNTEMWFKLKANSPAWSRRSSGSRVQTVLGATPGLVLLLPVHTPNTHTPPRERTSPSLSLHSSHFGYTFRSNASLKPSKWNHDPHNNNIVEYFFLEDSARRMMRWTLLPSELTTGPPLRACFTGRRDSVRKLRIVSKALLKA